MGKIDDAERAEMIALLLRERQARKDLTAAEEAVAQWQGHLEQAERYQETTLAGQARERLVAAQEAARQARHALDVIQQEKSVLRHAANLPEEHDTASAEALLEDFRALGVNPEEAELRQVSREQSAADLLDALKKKMGGS